LAQADHLQRDSAIKTFLPGTIDHALSAATDLFEQIVVTEISKLLASSRFGAQR
jgi:hypothetical protein